MNAKQTVDQIQPMQGKGMIKQISDYLRGETTKPEWGCLMYKNAARPKATFLLNRKLATVDRLAK